jgi:hypothetical protein
VVFGLLVDLVAKRQNGLGLVLLVSSYQSQAILLKLRAA